MTIKRQAKTYITRLFCDKCFQDGSTTIEMKRSDVVLASYPVKYQYSCPKCNYSTMSTKFFPTTSVETMEE